MCIRYNIMCKAEIILSVVIPINFTSKGVDTMIKH